MKMPIGTMIKKNLEILGFSLEDLSELTGIDLDTLIAVSVNNLFIDVNMAQTLAEMFGGTSEGWLKAQAEYCAWYMKTTLAAV